MPNSPPRESLAPPPDKPIAGGTTSDDEDGRPLSPSLKQIPLPCCSLTSDRPSMPPSGEQQRPARVNPSTWPLECLPSRLPEITRTAGTSPSQPPPWVPPSLRQHPLLRRGSIGWQTPSSSRQHIEKSLGLNPDPESARHEPHLELALEHSRSIPPGSGSAPTLSVTMPTTSTKKRKREATPQLQPSEPQLLPMPIGKEEEDVSQEELAQEQSDSDSSPIREPQPPLVPIWTNSRGKVYYGLTSDRAALDTYGQAWQKYKEKQARQEKLPTLRPSLTVSAVMESYGPKQKEILLDASKSVLSLSAYLDGKKINRCTGIVVEWNAEKGCGIIITSARLICTDKPSMIGWIRNLLPRPRLKRLNTHDKSLICQDFAMIFKYQGKLEVPQPTESSFLGWWEKANATEGLVRQGINSLIILGAWTLWNHRNRCMFDGSGSPNVAGALVSAKEERRLWTLVLVHLLDGSTTISKLLYFSKHYDLAFYEVFGDLNLKILPLEANLEYGQDLSILARDMKMDLICKEVNVKYLDPCEHQHNHYLFINHSIPKCGSGGALADLNGRVVGMLFCTVPLTAFIPSSLILKCSILLRKFGRLARPELGLKLRTMGFLDMSSIESLSRNCGITSGLIVGEVSAECIGERFGIRAGDVILSCQGESISSATQWEEILLDIGGEHLEKSNDLSLKVDVEVDVFHVRKGIRRTITLNAELSDGNEVFRSV